MLCLGRAYALLLLFTTLSLPFCYSLAAIAPKQVVLLLLLLLLAATIVGAHHLAYGLCELLRLDITLDA